MAYTYTSWLMLLCLWELVVMESEHGIFYRDYEMKEGVYTYIINRLSTADGFDSD